MRTGLVSNSWGTRRYPRDLLAELFDGRRHLRRGGLPQARRARSTSWARSGSAAEPADCVFVDDLAFNLKPARELGMAVVHHTAAASTLAELDELLVG